GPQGPVFIFTNSTIATRRQRTSMKSSTKLNRDSRRTGTSFEEGKADTDEDGNADEEGKADADEDGNADEEGKADADEDGNADEEGKESGLGKIKEDGTNDGRVWHDGRMIAGGKGAFRPPTVPPAQRRHQIRPNKWPTTDAKNNGVWRTERIAARVGRIRRLRADQRRRRGGDAERAIT
ncbi:hypothetical protein K474DRAFT_1681001, partial [Panus rudis PR-1116 ss-1]